MTQINAYLTFNGDCREAMTFYKECLGGELTLQSVADSPMADQWPAQAQKNILHAALTKDTLSLFASDNLGLGLLANGNKVSLSLSCSSLEETNTFFANLSANGKIINPLHEFFAGMMGVIEDKYGFTWMFYYAHNQTN